MGRIKSGTKKIQSAWAMYDWANSAYNLVITSTIFPAYYTAMTTIKENGILTDDSVDFFGIKIKNTTLFDYTLAAAYLIIALLSPILSSIADYGGNKKKFMAFFMSIGAISCMCLFFFQSINQIELGMILFGLAAVGYCGSIVFYNAYLPEIATPAEQDKVSAKGFAYGYVGSVLLQIICLVFVLNDDWFHDKTFSARLSFLLVGIWWFVFALIPLRFLHNGQTQPSSNRNFMTGGFYELKKVWGQIKTMPVLKSFLRGFFFYSMGVQTVMLAAAIFGSKELNLETQQLIIIILLIQLVAIPGALLMAFLSKKIGNFSVILMVLCLWILVCVFAYYTTTANEFYALGAFVGLIMGGIQSLSRSTYSKIMPATKDTASFFSFYDVCEKVAIVIGMVTFGWIDQHFGMRQSILMLLVFFIIGAVFIYGSKKIQAKHLHQQ